MNGLPGRSETLAVIGAQLRGGPTEVPHGVLERCAGGLMHLCRKHPGPLGRLPRAGQRWWPGGRHATNLHKTKRTKFFIVLSRASRLGPPAPTRSVGHPP